MNEWMNEWMEYFMSTWASAKKIQNEQIHQITKVSTTLIMDSVPKKESLMYFAASTFYDGTRLEVGLIKIVFDLLWVIF